MAVRTWEPLAPVPGEPRWVGRARLRLSDGAPLTTVARQVGKHPDTVRRWLQPQAECGVAGRIAQAIEEFEHMRTLYFGPDGRRMDDFKYRDAGPPGAVFVIEYPFRPSLASCEDMAREQQQSGGRIVYDEQRWATDSRIEEQAGPSVFADWLAEQESNEKVAA